MIQIQDNISEQKNLKDKLESEQEKLHVEYNKVRGRLTQRLPTFFHSLLSPAPCGILLQPGDP